MPAQSLIVTSKADMQECRDNNTLPCTEAIRSPGLSFAGGNPNGGTGFIFRGFGAHVLYM